MQCIPVVPALSSSSNHLTCLTSFLGAIAQDCDFEKSLCNYKQDQADNFDWRWFHGATYTSNTGPTSDHTPKTNISKCSYNAATCWDVCWIFGCLSTFVMLDVQCNYSHTKHDYWGFFLLVWRCTCMLRKSSLVAIF